MMGVETEAHKVIYQWLLVEVQIINTSQGCTNTSQSILLNMDE